MDMRAIAMGVAFAFIWASAFSATRIVVVAVPPLTALVLRFTLSGVIGVGLALAMGQRWRLSRSEWRSLIVFGLCQNALYLGANWIGMQWVEASAAAIIASMMPLLVAGSGWLFRAERLRPVAAAGLVIGLGGVALVMGARLEDGLHLGGVLILLFGVLALTVATLAARGAGGGDNVVMVVGLQMLVGAAALVPPALLLEWGQPAVCSPPVVAGFVFSVLFPGLLATWIWLLLVRRIGAVRAATFHFLSPVFGVAIAALLLGERFGVVDIIGAAIVAAGILMVQLSRMPPAAR
ncbi:EamA family transporter [Paracoccus sp. S-4012]|uniref:DMT family transporter n=1 Tax=Paracoccus sp. S-4012 TaxID=2665648 RepID=UPI0012B0DAAD|nr:DMT family transporter [Paracoccus sp. S-4012]MRX50944.1 EamA family transporter [Paracoccus sp. S-4012]